MPPQANRRDLIYGPTEVPSRVIGRFANGCRKSWPCCNDREMKIWLTALLLSFVSASAVEAHAVRVPKDTSGITISPLSHGQMAVIADHRDDIHLLATWLAGGDAGIRDLMDFSRLQYARCFWGMMPGSIEDEASPFNECSHAYLAADQAILLRMRALPGWQEKTAALFDTVERSMVLRGSSLVLCAYSATSFNTASPVDPDWHDFATHKPSLLTALGSSLGLLLAATLLIVLIRRDRAASRPSLERDPPSHEGSIPTPLANPSP